MTNKSLRSNILTFITTYGESALQEAMQQYIDNQQIYIYKTKSCIARIKISDIYYLQCQQHNITIHTSHGIYKKYGTLIQELNTLFPYGFIKCTQSCIVSLSKIKSIQNNDITLTNDTALHVSRSYAPKLLSAFNAKVYADNSSSSSNSNISVKKGIPDILLPDMPLSLYGGRRGMFPSEIFKYLLYRGIPSENIHNIYIHFLHSICYTYKNNKENIYVKKRK